LGEHRVHERWVKVNGIRTRYVESGDGEPFVMIHGGGPGGSWRGWRTVIGTFAEHFRVIVVDALGYGETDKPAGIEYSEMRIARHLGDFLETLSLDDINLMGNSKGAYWAARAMVDDPKRVKRYVAVGTNTVARAMGLERIMTPGLKALMKYDGSDESMRGFLDAILYRRASDEFVRDRNKMANLPGAAEMRASNSAWTKRLAEDTDIWQNFSLEQRLPKLTVPILIVWGAEDSFAPVSQAHDLHRLLPNSSLHIIPNAGHQCHTDNPEAFIPIVRDFLLLDTRAAQGAKGVPAAGNR